MRVSCHWSFEGMLPLWPAQLFHRMRSCVCVIAAVWWWISVQSIVTRQMVSGRCIFSQRVQCNPCLISVGGDNAGTMLTWNMDTASLTAHMPATAQQSVETQLVRLWGVKKWGTGAPALLGQGKGCSLFAGMTPPQPSSQFFILCWSNFRLRVDTEQLGAPGSSSGFLCSFRPAQMIFYNLLWLFEASGSTETLLLSVTLNLQKPNTNLFSTNLCRKWW